MQTVNIFKVDALPFDLWLKTLDRAQNAQLKCLGCASKALKKLVDTYCFYKLEKNSPHFVARPVRIRFESLTVYDNPQLVIAVKLGLVGAVKKLLKNITETELSNVNCLALPTAVRNSEVEILKLLLQHPYANLNTAFTDAVEQGNEQLVDLILNSACFLKLRDPQAEIYYGVIGATFRGNYAMACKLVKVLVKPSIFGENPLKIACKKGDFKFVDLLLNSKKIAVPDNILELAVMGGNLESISLVLNTKGIDINYADAAALTRAISERNPEIVKLILDHEDVYVDESLSSDDPEIALLLKSHLDFLNEDRHLCANAVDPIFLEPIPDEKLIFWKEKGAMQCFNEDALSQHVSFNGFTNPLTRSRLPVRIIRKISTDLSIRINAGGFKLSVAKKISVGLLVLNLWQKFSMIPNELTSRNFYLNYTGKPQHLMSKQLLHSTSLFDLDPAHMLCDLPPNFTIEVVGLPEAKAQIELGRMIPYLKDTGIAWL